jgi:hypothetical protein
MLRFVLIDLGGLLAGILFGIAYIMIAEDLENLDA